MKRNIIATLALIVLLAFTTNEAPPEKTYKLEELTAQEVTAIVASIRSARGVMNFDETNALLMKIDNQIGKQVKADTLQKKK